MKKPFSVLRRSAEEIKQYRVIMRVTPKVMGLIALLLALVFIISMLYSRYGAFTVTISKDSLKYSLSLCETQDFMEPTTRINAKAVLNVTNIDGEKDIPADVDKHDGEHNGENYAAYTFYCKNAGSDTFTYRYQIYIANTTLGIESAVRVRLYINGVPTTYARTREDGKGPEKGTAEFKTDSIVVEKDIANFKPGDVTKFTVVLWIEGTDDQCVNKIIGGEFKVDMNMRVIGGSTAM